MSNDSQQGEPPLEAPPLAEDAPFLPARVSSHRVLFVDGYEAELA